MKKKKKKEKNRNIGIRNKMSINKYISITLNVNRLNVSIKRLTVAVSSRL